MEKGNYIRVGTGGGINGSFEDVIKVSVTPTPEKKVEEKPVQKKKKPN